MISLVPKAGSSSGGVVGGLVYAIYGPIFGLSKVLLPKKPGDKAAATAPAVPGGGR